MLSRPATRRSILKRSLVGLLAIGPAAAALSPRSAFAAVCDTCDWRLVNTECVGPDLYINMICVDPVQTYIICETDQIYAPDNPACTAEDTEGEADANGLRWAAELGYGGGEYGMLRARTAPSAPGAWEQFQLLHLSPDSPNSDNPSSLTYAIQSLANGLYVSTELGYSGGEYGMLRARAGAIGAWEQYRLEPIWDQLYAVKSLANGLYVSTELGYTSGWYGMLRARATSIGAWERHWLFRP